MAKNEKYQTCPCGKRGFEEHAVGRALGKAKTKRNRSADKAGVSRRGMTRESRHYPCDQSRLYHLTSQSNHRREEVYS